ncbi:hypothetical protein SAMN02799642_02776 [Methylobacterium brachiatum]|nr:hypothetical protein SAMN02799642_02776 [Methylobacterium brachiatum]
MPGLGPAQLVWNAASSERRQVFASMTAYRPAFAANICNGQGKNGVSFYYNRFL